MPRRSLILILSLLACASCDRGTTAPTSDPTTAPAAPAPPVQPLAKLPVVILVDNQAIECPSAILTPVSPDTPEHLMLYSDDPPEAAHEGYHGNSFYFDFKVESADRDGLIATIVKIKPAAVEHEDVPEGIFVDGQNKILSPQDVTITFEPAGDHLVAKVSGTFQLADSSQPDIHFSPSEVTSRMPVACPH